MNVKNLNDEYNIFNRKFIKYLPCFEKQENEWIEHEYKMPVKQRTKTKLYC